MLIAHLRGGQTTKLHVNRTFASARDIAFISIRSEIQSQGEPRLTYRAQSANTVRFSRVFSHLRRFRTERRLRCPGSSEGEKREECEKAINQLSNQML